LSATDGAVAVLRPERLPTVSYAYEWSFGQLKDAALLTLEIMRRAMAKGMVIKDASVFNVQFSRGRPVLIDTLSFEKYVEGEPWIAYRQFCEHFLAPLALMALVDVRLRELLRSHIDGVPLDLAARLLPGSSRLNTGLTAHVHLHAKAIRGSGASTGTAKVSRTGLLALVDSLRKTVTGLHWEPTGTTWADYYDNTNYSVDSMDEKKRLVAEFLDRVSPVPKTCWDLGANDGEFSLIAARRGIPTVAWDFDPAAVELAYRRVRADREEHLLPLVQNLTNPSPSLGWASEERGSFASRGPADVAFALALVHHLAIGNNVPLPRVAQFFASIAHWLIVEFVPKEDSQVQRMLSGRRDVFDHYSQGGFERAFGESFRTVDKQKIPGTERTLYLLENLNR
jgi:hypothetical protein